MTLHKLISIFELKKLSKYFYYSETASALHFFFDESFKFITKKNRTVRNGPCSSSHLSIKITISLLTSLHYVALLKAPINQPDSDCHGGDEDDHRLHNRARFHSFKGHPCSWVDGVPENCLARGSSVNRSAVDFRKGVCEFTRIIF